MRLAIFTLLRNESVFFPVWLEHYLQHVPAEDIYVLDHESSGDSLDTLHCLQAEHKFNLIRLQHQWAYNALWMANTARHFQTFLFSTYKHVLFSAADELVSPRPEVSLKLPEFAAQILEESSVVKCNGFEVVHNVDAEAPLDVTQPWLSQRKWWYHSPRYSKPLLSAVPLYWRPGWFGAVNVPMFEAPYRDLLLVHLHKIDLQLCVERHQQAGSQPWHPEARSGPLAHNVLEDPERLSRWLLSNADDSTQYAQLVEIPTSLKEKLQCRITG